MIRHCVGSDFMEKSQNYGLLRHTEQKRVYGDLTYLPRQVLSQDLTGMSFGQAVSSNPTFWTGKKILLRILTFLG